jgi:hypothetical protein
MSTVLAHGGVGTPRLVNVASGPYLVTAWTDPDPLRVDETHVVVALSDPQSNELIVSGVELAVQFKSLDDPSLVVTANASPDEVNRLLFAAVFNDRLEAGKWRVSILVDGESGTASETGFDVEVEPARRQSLTFILLGGTAIAGLTILLALRRFASR